MGTGQNLIGTGVENSREEKDLHELHVRTAQKLTVSLPQCCVMWVVYRRAIGLVVQEWTVPKKRKNAQIICDKDNPYKA